MPDFLRVVINTEAKGGAIAYPTFICGRVKDIMVQGGKFKAAWDEDNSVWITDKNLIPGLIDREIDKAIDAAEEKTGYSRKAYREIRYARLGTYKVMNEFKNYIENQMADNYIPLDHKLVFKSDPYRREDYSTTRLPYDIVEMDTPAFDKMIETLYYPQERKKIMWAIGSILSGDSKKIQKFFALYGLPGKGKGTIIKIIEQLFPGYYSTFNADALTSRSSQFSMEPFKNNPLVAIDADAELKYITDNTRLNTIVSHEYMIINEKHKQQYRMKIESMLFVATNDPIQITSVSSGLMRRLVDIRPSGNLLVEDEYFRCEEQIPFELGGIAYKCLQVYLENPKAYNKYIPVEQLSNTNETFLFLMEYRDAFESEEYTTLKVAYDRYKKFCEDSGIDRPLKRMDFGRELKNYFEEFYPDCRTSDGVHRSFVYKGFKYQMYTRRSEDEETLKKLESKDIFDTLPEWLKLEQVGSDVNILNRAYAGRPAQYAFGPDEVPKKKWDDVATKLTDILTTQTHYVMPPAKHIIIDFDLKDPKTGKKSLELNLKAAAKFPKTYAETSKSGNGLHLHYIYDGDTDELSMLYDEGIEIKVFKGKSALRRRLSLCNNEEIAHLNSGLPLKEVKKKMIDWDVVKDERHLRACIKKALRREIHANTRPSIDFIKMKTDEAYDSGMHYDVSDMYQAVMNFAAMSTNQSEYCMNLVLEMKFKSEEPSDNVADIHNIDKPIAFFDWEVFPNLSILCYKIEGGTIGEEGKKEVIRIINPTSNQVSDFFSKYRAIGFNNLGYDNDISYGRILGYTNEQLYKLSKSLIVKDKGDSDRAINVRNKEAKNLSYTDIYDFANGDNRKSLKQWEIELGLHHQEFPYDWDKPVPEDKWEEAADYCANDVVATEVVFYHLKADFNARCILAKVSGLTVNDKTNAHTCRIIFGNNRNPQSSFNYPDLSKEFPGYEFSQFGIDEERYNKWPDGKSVKTTGKSIFMGDDPSEGGYVYYEPGIYHNNALLDIASLHPTSIEVMQLFGPEYTARFSEIKAARVALKHKDWDKARGYLGGALIPFLEGVENKSSEEQQQIADDMSYAFKIPINAVFGLTAAKFPNPCRDPRNIDNVVAKRGALFMILLKNEVQKRGFTVVHIKTDSIKIAEATQDIIDFVMDFGTKYGYTFEHEATYEKMCLLNKAVYIAKYDEFGERTKGGRHANCWTATGAEFQHPYIFKTLFSHEPLILKDYCETKQVSNGAYIYLDFNEDMVRDDESLLCDLEEELNSASKGKMDIRKQIKEAKERIESTHNLSFVGKCGSFIPVQKGAGGGIMVRVDGDKVGAVAGTKGYRWLDSETVTNEGLEHLIDKVYFRALVDSSVDHIAQYGDADEFING